MLVVLVVVVVVAMLAFLMLLLQLLAILSCAPSSGLHPPPGGESPGQRVSLVAAGGGGGDVSGAAANAVTGGCGQDLGVGHDDRRKRRRHLTIAIHPVRPVLSCLVLSSPVLSLLAFFIRVSRLPFRLLLSIALLLSRLRLLLY